MSPLPKPDELLELRNRLKLLRIYIAGLADPALNDLDALLSVAEAEVERAISTRQKSE